MSALGLLRRAPMLSNTCGQCGCRRRRRRTPARATHEAARTRRRLLHTKHVAEVKRPAVR
eukprot:2813852-Pleurochrysis_carterae.AAC.1